MQAAPVAAPLLAAVDIVRNGSKGERSTEFLRPGSKWRRHLRAQPDGDFRLWEVAVLFHLRDAFRSGDIWLARSRRYGDIKQTLIPAQAITQTSRLAVPLRPEEWLSGRRSQLDARLKELGRAARAGAIPGGSIEKWRPPYRQARGRCTGGGGKSGSRPLQPHAACPHHRSPAGGGRQHRIFRGVHASAERSALRRSDRPDERQSWRRASISACERWPKPPILTAFGS